VAGRLGRGPFQRRRPAGGAAHPPAGRSGTSPLARHIIELADETLTGYDLRTGARIDPGRSAGTGIDLSR